MSASTPRAALRAAAWALALALPAGCATTGLTPEGAQVRLVSAPFAEGCEELGRVHGRNGPDVHIQQRHIDAAQQQARNRAAELGADALVITRQERPWYRDAVYVVIEGRALRCGPAPGEGEAGDGPM